MNYYKMPEEEFVEYLLSHKEITPCLLVGKYVDAFKRRFRGTIERVYSLNKVRSLIDEYEGIDEVNSGFLVLEGVGYLSNIGQNSLLKFIEESKLPIVLLSYQDSVINTIRSRMKFFLKSVEPIKSMSYLGVQEAQSNIKEKQSKDPNFKDSLVVQFMANNCPDLYGMVASAGTPYDSYNSRIVNILSINVKKVEW